MGADCKSAGYAYAGSNPARPTSKTQKIKDWKLSFVSFLFLIFFARVAQW